MTDCFWIQEIDRSSRLVGYYTREPDGLSGMTPAALAQLVSVLPSEVEDLVNRVFVSSSDKNDLPVPLKMFAGQNLNLLNSESIDGAETDIVIPDFFCQAIIDYYTSYAAPYEGQEIARQNKATLLSGAVKLFIWSKTGHKFDKNEESYWYKRIKVALSSQIRPIPKNYFSIYVKMMEFFQQMETQFGYVIPDKNPDTSQYLVPDISIGLGFNDFLRSDTQNDRKIRLDFLGSEEPIDFREFGKDNNQIEKYQHIYPQESHGFSNKQMANAYPIKYSGIFEYYLTNVWIPEKFVLYINERDKYAVSYLKGKILELSSGEVAILRNSILGGVIDVLRPKIKGL